MLMNYCLTSQSYGTRNSGPDVGPGPSYLNTIEMDSFPTHHGGSIPRKRQATRQMSSIQHRPRRSATLYSKILTTNVTGNRRPTMTAMRVRWRKRRKERNRRKASGRELGDFSVASVSKLKRFSLLHRIEQKCVPDQTVLSWCTRSWWDMLLYILIFTADCIPD